MLTNDQYTGWALAHIRAIGFADQAKALEQFVQWFDTFRVYPLDELTAATAEVLRRTDPPTVMIQRAAVLEAIHALREKRLQHNWLADEADRGQGTCTLCGNSGWLAVPHWRNLDAGRWCPEGGHYRRVTVACRCRIGQRRYAGFDDNQRPMSLERYERQFCPRWREEERHRRLEEQALPAPVAYDPFWKAQCVDFAHHVRKMRERHCRQPGDEP